MPDGKTQEKICKGVVSLKQKDSIDKEVLQYLEDPNTKVVVYKNDEAGVWQYSIMVVNSGGFWLDSFPAKAKARDYVKHHDLTLVE